MLIPSVSRGRSGRPQEVETLRILYGYPDMKTLRHIRLQERLTKAVGAARNSLLTVIDNFDEAGQTIPEHWREHLEELNREYDYVSTADVLSQEYLARQKQLRAKDEAITDEIVQFVHAQRKNR